MKNVKTLKSNRGQYAALGGATGLLLLNFWAWSLLSPLATTYAKHFLLSPVAVSLLVAAPVLIGSLARILFGALTDRYGGRKMFSVVCILSAAAVASLALVDSYSMLLMVAFALGVAGATFAIGIPFVSAWFPKNKRGFALGIYAVGNAGTAISGLLTPHLVSISSRSVVFMSFSVVLLLASVMSSLWIHDAQSWHASKTSMLVRLKQALSWTLTWRLAMLYALTFGAFVAFGLYLPVLLNQSYGLSATDAASRAAGFVLLATLVRPIGGWLSDKLNGVIVLRFVFLTMFILSGLAATKPSLMPTGTISYLGLALALGIGNGAIFAIIGHRCKTNLVGSVTGLVGAAGGLGGFFPPLIMGASYQLFHSYSAALLMLAAISLIIFASVRRLFDKHTSD